MENSKQSPAGGSRVNTLFLSDLCKRRTIAGDRGGYGCGYFGACERLIAAINVLFGGGIQCRSSARNWIKAGGVDGDRAGKDQIAIAGDL